MMSSCSVNTWSTTCSRQVNYIGQFLNNNLANSSSSSRLTTVIYSKISRDVDYDGDQVSVGAAAKGSRTSARSQRLVKVREEKRKREYKRTHKYPAWAKVLEDACKHDAELRAVLSDSIGNPELMKQMVQERVSRKGGAQKDFLSKSKIGFVLAFKGSFSE